MRDSDLLYTVYHLTDEYVFCVVEDVPKVFAYKIADTLDYLHSLGVVPGEFYIPTLVGSQADINRKQEAAGAPPSSIHYEEVYEAYHAEVWPYLLQSYKWDPGRYE